MRKGSEQRKGEHGWLNLRVLLGPPGGEPANIWVAVKDQDGAVLVRLWCEYPDLHPARGWRVEGDCGLLEVISVDEKQRPAQLVCKKVGV